MPRASPSCVRLQTPVTLRHLLTHTSGFCYDTWDGELFRYSTAMAGQTAANIGPLGFEPGSRWQYGQGVDWAGRLVEKLSGMNLEEYFQAKILRPLGMPDTQLHPARRKIRAPGHRLRAPAGWVAETG